MNDEQCNGLMDFELHPDDHTIAAQDEQRLELIEDFEREGMLEERMLKALEGTETLGEGLLRPTIRRYYELDFGLADVVAEIAGRAGW